MAKNFKYCSKLNERERELIFKLYTEDEKVTSYRELAEQFNVTYNTIYKTIKKMEQKKQEEGK